MQNIRAVLRHRWRLIAGWALVALGGLAALLGWVGVSGKDLEALQLPYLASGGIGALVLTGVGVTLLISNDLRADRERLSRIEGELLELQDLVRAFNVESARRVDSRPRRESASRLGG